jgi:uncharacterized protein (TIGR02452 family)
MPRLGKDLGRVTLKDGSYDWVRCKNAMHDRLDRLLAWQNTAHAVSACGYKLPEGAEVRLSTQDMLADMFVHHAQPRPPPTSTRWSNIPSRKPLSASISWAGEGVTVMQAAVQLQRAGKKTVAVSAASAHQVGGGTLSGGRHALEESWCIMSTLLSSLQKHQWDLEEKGRSKAQDGKHVKQHIPVDACIVSPSVTVFRGTSSEGYVFSEHPTTLLGVCSLAMFNMNPAVSENPVDAPWDFQDYCSQVKQKFRAVYSAANQLGADVLVCPDIGCGVFGNDPVLLGYLLGEVVREESAAVAEVILTGKWEFGDAAKRRADGENFKAPVPSYFQRGAPPRQVAAQRRTGRE